MGSPARAPAGNLGIVLFALLALLAVAAFAVTRAARTGDDLVNTVELTPVLEPGQDAVIRFKLAEPDRDVDVLIIEGDPGVGDEQVRALELRADLPAGLQAFRWDGTGDDGEPVPAGLYALRVILGEQGRDIRPPGRIRVLEPARQEAG